MFARYHKYAHARGYIVLVLCLSLGTIAVRIHGLPPPAQRPIFYSLLGRAACMPGALSRLYDAEYASLTLRHVPPHKNDMVSPLNGCLLYTSDAADEL